MTATMLAPFALAQEALTQGSLNEDDGSRLDTLTVEGNRLYDMLPSEISGGYGVDAATVGTKTPASLRDIPQSVTVLTRDYLSDRQFTTLDQAAKYTPGLRTLTNDDGRSSIFSRGYEYNEYNIDGLPAPMSSIWGTLPAMAALDRVEIMRGPSGLFNSTSELGGIINMVRKRPTDTFSGTLTGRYGRWDQHYLEADIGGPLDAEGRLRGRLDAAVADRDSFVDVKGNRNESLYGALDFDLSNATTLGVGWWHQRKDIVPGNGLAAWANGDLLDVPRSTFLGADWNTFEGEMDDAFVELTHRFANGAHGRVAARGSWRNADLAYAYTASGVDSDGNAKMAAIGRTFSQDVVSLDASYSQPFAAFGTVSEFVLGSDFKRYETDYRAWATRGLGTTKVFSHDPGAFDRPDLGYTTATSQTEKEAGLYAKLTMRPVASLALIGGARVSWYDVDNETTDLPTGASTHDTQSLNAEVTPYAGVVWDLDEAHSLYASYSEVFKPQSDLGSDDQLLDPRQGQQYEAGIKGSYHGGSLNTRFSLFQLTDENRATTPFNANGTPISGYMAALGETRIRGVELELSGEVLPGWEWLAGYSYLDTETLAGDEEAVFAIMPRHHVTLWNTYEASGMLSGWRVGAGINAMSDFHYESRGARIDAPGYGVVDALIGYDFSQALSATLNVNNVLDKTYYSRVGSPATFNFYGEPRSVVAELRYTF